jgi:hypothetical protein
MFKQKLISILTFLIVIGQILTAANFILNLEVSEEQCLDEYFSDKTLVIYQISSSSDKTKVRISDPEDAVLYDKVR